MSVRHRRFAGRELSHDVAAVTVSELQRDVVYFDVRFLDKNDLIPMMEPLSFTGDRITIDGSARFCFLPLGPYYPRPEPELKAEYRQEGPVSMSRSGLTTLFTFDGALEILMLCSLRRREARTGTTCSYAQAPWFPARDLPSFSQPVIAESLMQGEIYFAISFSDMTMSIPSLTPLVYLGRKLEPDEDDDLYFQDLDSYLHGARFGTPTEYPGATIVLEPPTGPQVYEYDRALDQILLCSLHRNSA